MIDVLLASCQIDHTITCLENPMKNDNIRYFILEESLCRGSCDSIHVGNFYVKRPGIICSIKEWNKIHSLQAG